MQFMLTGPRKNCLITESGRVLCRVRDDDPDGLLTAVRYMNSRDEEDNLEVPGVLYH